MHMMPPAIVNNTRHTQLHNSKSNKKKRLPSSRKNRTPNECRNAAHHRKCSEASLNWGPENAAQRVADIVLHVCDGGRPAMAALEHVCICTSKERDGPKSAARPNQRQRGPTGTRAHGMWSSARESRLSRGLVVRPRRLLFHQRLLRLD